MVAHAPWSREEVSLLLRAWAGAAESRPPREVGHAAFLRYETLYCASACGGHGSVSSRAEASVFNKRKSLENMYTIISLFLASISVTSSQNKVEEEEWSYLRSSDKLRAWFGMPETKRRRWFSVHNRKSYLYTEMTEEQFAMITEILVKSNGGILPPFSVYVRPKAKIAKSESEPESIAVPALSNQDMAAAIVHARESFRIVMERFTSRNGPDTIYMKDEGVFIAAAAQVVEEEPAVIAPAPPAPPQFQIGNPVVEGDGSDTESDGDWEEVVPPSPIREADAGSDAINTGTGPQKRKLSRPTSDTYLHDSIYPDKRARIVYPELLNVLNALEKQTRTLKEAYRSTKLARRRDQVERQEILRSLRQEQNERQQILESLRRQEEEVRQQRAAWRREQEEIRREYAELLEGN